MIHRLAFHLWGKLCMKKEYKTLVDGTLTVKIFCRFCNDYKEHSIDKKCCWRYNLFGDLEGIAWNIGYWIVINTPYCKIRGWLKR